MACREYRRGVVRWNGELCTVFWDITRKRGQCDHHEVMVVTQGGMILERAYVGSDRAKARHTFGVVCGV